MTIYEIIGTNILSTKLQYDNGDYRTTPHETERLLWDNREGKWIRQEDSDGSGTTFLAENEAKSTLVSIQEHGLDEGLQDVRIVEITCFAED